MKKALLAFSFLAVVGSSAPAFAVVNHVLGPKGIFQSQLTGYSMDESLGMTVNAGDVVVDNIQHTVTLNLIVNRACPGGVYCIPQAPIKIELPIRAYDKDACGGIIVTADKDMRMLDEVGGSLTQIQVTDNTTNHCLNYVALPPTTVKLFTQNRENRTLSVMSGSAFKLVGTYNPLDSQQ